MNNFQIPPQLVQAMKGGNNPQAILMNMLNGNNNPMAKNITSMINSNNMNGIESLARNIIKSKGYNPDEIYEQVKNQFK